MKLKALATGLFGIAAIAVAVAAGAGGTTASFSDQVSSNGNTFKAGTLELNIGSLCSAGRTYGGVTGNVGVDGNTGCSVTGGATYSPVTTAMKPGDSSSATYSVKNIGSLSGTLSVGTSSWSVTTAGKGTCTVSASNFTISSTYSATSVAAGATASVPVTGAVPTTSADGCQGATVTASVPFQMNGASTTGFSDKLTSTGNVFTMATLPAPTLTAAPDTDTTKVDLTWTGSYGSFPGTTFTGARYSGGTCSGGATAVNSGNAISSGYVDAPGSNAQFSYIVTAHFGTNWVALSNCATATTKANTDQLYINSNSTLSTSPDSGSSTINQTPTAWTAVTAATVTANTPWTIVLNFKSQPSTNESVTAVISWSTGVCLTTPDAAHTIASETLLPSGTWPNPATFTLTPNAGWTVPSGLVNICLSLSKSLNDNVTTFGDSYLQGPFS